MPKYRINLGLDEEIGVHVNEDSIVKEILVVKEPEEISKLLPMGISIPIWPEFEKYILFDLKHFKARSLLLTENNNPAGHVLVFYADKKVLYFGFFGVLNDRQERIEFLIDSLIEYARENGFESLKGPVNVPTIIYGWGFMEKGSISSLFVHKPVNKPLYPDIFRQKGFEEVLKEYSFEGTFDPSTSDYTKGFTYEDYDLLVFNTWEEITRYKIEFLKLNVRNLPPKSVVTPSSAAVFDSYLEFIKQYGDPSMMVFATYNKTSKIIGCLVATPNPFDKSSFTLLTVVVDKKHRNKGIGWLMFKELFTTSLRQGINKCTTFVGSHVETTIKMSERLKLPLKRTHTIFSYSIPDNAMKQEIAIQDRLERIFELLKEEEDGKASEMAEELLEINSQSDRGWLLLGIAHRRVGKLEEAINCFLKATEVNRSMEEAWGLLTITYLDAKREDVAKECLSKAVAFNPTSEELKFYKQNLIRIYNKFGPFF